MYVIPGSAGHAEIYKAMKGGTFKQDLFDRIIPSQVPFGASIFPKGALEPLYSLISIFRPSDKPFELLRLIYEIDTCYAPRWWAACKVASNIVFWKEHNKGGHFAATEKPVELAEDIREFTKAMSADILTGLKESGH